MEASEHLAVMASALWARKREDMPKPSEAFKEKWYFSPTNDYLSAGDWLRASFRKEFGRGIASRWFN